MKSEVVVVSLSDVDSAKEFQGRLGWQPDADFPFNNGFRAVQFMPPSSNCSVQFGTNMTSVAPGSAQGLHLIVSDNMHAALDINLSSYAIAIVTTNEVVDAVSSHY